MKTKYLIYVFLFLNCSGHVFGQESISYPKSGISALFLKKQELMTRNNWASPPLDLSTAYKNISRYDAIWCAQLVFKYNRPAWRLLRRNRPEQLMLYYISGCSVQINDSFTRLDYNYINKNHPEWFLMADNRNVRESDYKDHDKRIRWNPSDKNHSYYNRFYLDVANKDFQKWAAGQILALVSVSKYGSEHSYDGIAMDNVYVGRRLHKRLKFRYPHWKYAKDVKAWSDGYISYLQEIKKVLNQHGFILVANHNPVGSSRNENQQVWEALYESVDGLLGEQALRSGWTKNSYFTGYKWLAAIERHEEVLEKGLINWWACHPGGEDRRDDDIFLYTYCSWLLIQEPGKSFYSMHSMKSPAQISCWYGEYDLLIGVPASKRYLRNNCWLRDYENAKIIVNPTKRNQKVVIDPQRLWLDWSSKKTIREIELPPRSGRILLPTPYNLKTN